MVGKVMKKSSRTVEMKEGMVYVEQPMRTEWIPSMAPDCLKFETFLRIEDIPYEHVDQESLRNRETPLCKVGGKEIAYSPNMMAEVAKAMNKEYVESEDIDGVQRAFEALIEEKVHWMMVYMRATQANQQPIWEGYQGRFFQLLRPIANKVAASKLKTKADHQGIGRQNVQDVIASGKQDLKAISKYLGHKEYMNGVKPNKLDATTFAHLCQFWYIPTENELKTYMKEECANLVDYMERMKSKFWPDWTEKCRQPPPPPPTPKSKSKEDTSTKKTDGTAENDQVVVVKETTTDEKITTTTEEQPKMVCETTATPVTAKPAMIEVTTNGHPDPTAVLNGMQPIVVDKIESVEVVNVQEGGKKSEVVTIENGLEKVELTDKA